MSPVNNTGTGRIAIAFSKKKLSKLLTISAVFAVLGCWMLLTPTREGTGLLNHPIIKNGSALGAVLLEAKRPAEAETVYWEDLRHNRESGWSLFGLTQALKAQGKNDDAALVEARFKKAWARADVTLTASRFGR